MKGSIMSQSRSIRRAAAVIFLAGLGVVSAFGQTFLGSGTTTVSVTVGAEASIAINTSSTALTSSGTLFADYTGTTNLTYKVRTTPSTGSGSIVLQITSDFNGTGGPKVNNPPTSGDKLSYDCTVATSGTGCGANQTASTSSTTPVATFGSDAHSTRAGDAGTVSWTLTNDPAYKTGSYNATATFTISAT
jgi:hypothetical protein